MIELALDERFFKEAEGKLAGIRNGLQTAAMRALNRSITGVRTDVIKEVRNEITAKAKIIRNAFSLYRATITNLSASISAKGEPLNLIHFQPRETSKGITTKIRKSGPRVLWPRAFIATLGVKKGPQVYQRKYAGPKAKKTHKPHKPGFYARLPAKYRFPVKALMGPSIPDVMQNAAVKKKIETNAKERLDKNFAQQIKFLWDNL